MTLASFKNLLFSEEFVINERPLDVYETAPATVDTPEAGTLEAIMGGGGPRTRDLMSQMEELLIEQVRLTEKARQLEMNQSSDDEFGRFVRQALPFLDNFAHLLDLAREYPPSEELDNWLKSVEALYFRIVSLLETYGLRFINSLGKTVDLNYHEVVDYRSTGQYPHNTIMKEMQKGVVFRGHLLRDAKVVVACNSTETHDQ